jgi:sarcosine oxidase subunit beta
MSKKVIVCRCEDVTEDEVKAAIAHGYTDIEEVKRYTGFGTGPCQGKECHAFVALLLAKKIDIDPKSVCPFTARQPIHPTPLRFFAADPSRDRFGDES